MTQSYDLVLMDCHMPVMNGFEAAKEIRTLRIPQPTIIAVTANCTTAAREECLRAGMDHYVSKPFTADHLVHVIREALGQRFSGITCGAN
jgi:CheY-like chemotaxis protein